VNQELILRKEERGEAEVYKFWFQPSGWAVIVIDESMGLFSIESDWGRWSYYWLPRSHDEPSLKHFLLSADNHYLTGKLTMGKRDPWSPEDTRKLILEHAQQRLDQGCIHSSEVDKSDYLELVKEELDQCDWDSGPETFVRDAPEFLSKEFDPLYEYLVCAPDGQTLFLRNTLLPFCKQWFSQRLREDRVVRTYE